MLEKALFNMALLIFISFNKIPQFFKNLLINSNNFLLYLTKNHMATMRSAIVQQKPELRTI